MNHNDFAKFLFNNNLNDVFDVGITTSQYYSFPEAVSLLGEPTDGIYNAGDLFKFKKEKIFINSGINNYINAFSSNLSEIGNANHLIINKGHITDLTTAGIGKMKLCDENHDYGLMLFQITQMHLNDENVNFCANITLTPENIDQGFSTDGDTTFIPIYKIQDGFIRLLKKEYYVNKYEDLLNQTEILNPYDNLIYYIYQINYATGDATMLAEQTEFDTGEITEDTWMLLFFNKKLGEISTAFWQDMTYFIPGKTFKTNLDIPYLKLNIGWELLNNL